MSSATGATFEVPIGALPLGKAERGPAGVADGTQIVAHVLLFRALPREPMDADASESSRISRRWANRPPQTLRFGCDVRPRQRLPVGGSFQVGEARIVDDHQHDGFALGIALAVEPVSRHCASASRPPSPSRPRRWYRSAS